MRNLTTADISVISKLLLKEFPEWTDYLVIDDSNGEEEPKTIQLESLKQLFITYSNITNDLNLGDNQIIAAKGSFGNIINNLEVNEEGYILDARQGKVLHELIKNLIPGIIWQTQVLDIVKTPPSYEERVDGDRWIVDIGAVGDFSGFDGMVAEWIDQGAETAWMFYEPEERWGLFVKERYELFMYYNNVWTSIGSFEGLAEILEQAKQVRDDILDDPGFQAVKTDLLGPNKIGITADSISDVNIVANIKNNVVTVAGIVQDVSDVAGIKAAISNLSPIKDNITAVDGNKININKLAAIDNHVTLVSGIVQDVSNVAGIKAAISNLSPIKDNIISVDGNKANINLVAGINTAISNLSPIKDNITAVDGNKTNINAVAGNKTNIDKVANNQTNINKVSAIDTNVTTVAGIQADVVKVADIDADVVVVSENKLNIDKVAVIDSDVTTVAGINSAVSSVAEIHEDVSNVAGINAKVIVVSSIKDEVESVASIKNNIVAVDDNKTNINAVHGNKTNIDKVANNEVNINKVSAIDTEVTNVSGIKDNVVAVDANKTNINAVHANKTNIDKVALNEADIDVVATDLNLGVASKIKIVAEDKANIDAVASNKTNINAVNANKTNINAVALNKVNIDKVANIDQEVTDVAGIKTEVENVSAIRNNITAVDGNKTNINAVHANKNNIDKVANINNDVTKVANIDTDVSAVALIDDDVTDVALIKQDVTDVAGIKTNVTNVAGIKDNVVAVDGNKANINAVHANKTNIDAVAGNKTNIDAVKNNSANINTVAGNLSGANTIGTVAGSISNVNNVGGNIGNVNAVASNKSNIDAVAGNKSNIDTVAGMKDNINALAPHSQAVADLGARTAELDLVAEALGDIDDLEKVNNKVTEWNSPTDTEYPSAKLVHTGLLAFEKDINILLRRSGLLGYVSPGGWDEIADITQQGDMHLYHDEGDEFQTALKFGNDWVPAIVRIIGLNKDKLVRDSSAPSTTFEFKDILWLQSFDSREPNNSNSNRRTYGNNNWGWSNLRQYLNSENLTFVYGAKHPADAPPDNYDADSLAVYEGPGFLARLDPELASVIAPVKKWTALNTAVDGGGAVETEERVFLLSQKEVGLGDEGTVTNEFVYDLYNGAVNADRIKLEASGSAYRWWLRSPYVSTSGYVRIVRPDGSLTYVDACYSRGVAPAFVIG